MRALALLLCLALPGCAATSGKWVEDEVGALVMVEYLYPACSDVTVSAQCGPNRALICEFR